MPPSQDSPSNPGSHHQGVPPAGCPSCHPPLLFSPAVLLSVTQRRVPEEEELKLQTGPGRGDRQGHVNPCLGLDSPTPPCSPHSQVPG